MHIYRGSSAGKSGGLPGFTEIFFRCEFSTNSWPHWLRVRNCFTVPVTEVMVGRDARLEKGSRVMAITHAGQLPPEGMRCQNLTQRRLN